MGSPVRDAKFVTVHTLFAYQIHDSRYSILPALSMSGVLYLKIVEGSFNTELFIDFITGLLSQMNHFPGDNSVIVMDNCRIHKSEEIVNLIHDRYAFVNYIYPRIAKFHSIVANDLNFFHHTVLTIVQLSPHLDG